MALTAQQDHTFTCTSIAYLNKIKLTMKLLTLALSCTLLTLGSKAEP